MERLLIMPYGFECALREIQEMRLESSDMMLLTHISQYSLVDGLTKLTDLHTLTIRFLGVSNATTALSNLLAGTLTDINVLARVPSLPVGWKNMKKLKVLNLGVGGTALPTEELEQMEQLTSLTIYRNETLPVKNDIPRLDNLTSLQTIFFSGFNLTKIPEGIENLTNLTSLSLRHCNISGTVPFISSKLKHLDLSRNSFEELAPNFKDMINLESLSISQNQLTGNLSNYFSFPNLQTLDLSHNRISGVLPHYLNNLKKIVLNSNKISGTLPEVLGNRLETLFISYNNLTGGIKALTNSSLVHIDVSYNNLEGPIYSRNTSAGDLPLQTLILSFNKLNGTLPFIAMSSIRVLALNGNNFIGAIPQFWREPGIEGSQDFMKFISGVDRIDLSNLPKIGGGQFPFVLSSEDSINFCDFGTARFHCDFQPSGSCRTGPCYTGDPCKQEGLDFCVGSTCNSTVSTTNWYTCDCWDNYDRKNINDIYTCYPKDPCKLFPCAGSDRDRDCINGPFEEATRQCICRGDLTSPSSGKWLTPDELFVPCTNICVDPGCIQSEPRGIYSTCSSVDNTYRNCVCDTGYELRPGARSYDLSPDEPFGGCIDIDECLYPEVYQCAVGEECVNLQGSWACQCAPGYSRNTDDGECSASGGFPTGAIIGVVIGVVVIFIVIAVIIYLRKSYLNLSSLPPDVRWFYERYQASPSSWKKEGSDSTIYYSKEIEQGTEAWARMRDIFDNFCHGKDIQIQEAISVYNPTLIAAFISQRNIMAARWKNDSQIFAAKQFILQADGEARVTVLERYKSRVEHFRWNKQEGCIPIVPAAHGTEFSIGKKICSTGFASLSMLDAGWYGQGIYFTTYVLYAFPYFSTKEQPAIVLSWINPGNVFPVIESPSIPNTKEQFGKDREDRPSLVGKAIKSGYNSHYVVTKSDGRPVEAKDMKAFKCYDEIVIPQESQVTPFMLIRVDTRNFNVLAKEWNREVLIPGRSRDHMTSESDSYIPLLEQSF
eukprot:TRINITY_DN516_c0_g1_i14.p1 TRINITY_DN516_c0_g1~~TRINITY_DN516_c0_g1_i14.p1  ORF type:complete len:998 (-),score=85.22 TRINITY_DN516_c0_g1_i14:65-3058(-)